MKIVIDLQGAQTGSRFRGIGRYTLALTREMIKQGPQHDFVIVLNGAFADTLEPLRKEFGTLLPKQNIRVWLPPADAMSRTNKDDKRRKQAEVIYESFLASLSPDIVLITTFFEFGDDVIVGLGNTSLKVPTAVIAYDFIPLHDPDYYLADGFTKTLYMERLAALETAQLLLAISEHSANDVGVYLLSGDREVVNISAACSDIFVPAIDDLVTINALKKQFSIGDQFIITSGNENPHKNLQRLFAAFGRLPESVRNQYQLVLLGGANDHQRKIYADWGQEVGLSPKNLIVTGYISDSELVSLYSHTRLMVFPSLDEGFGLPPLEAMSCGTPAIASNRASLPEVIGLDAASFDPCDIDAMSRLILRVIEDDEFHATLVDHAQVQTKKFSWARSAKLALAAIEKLGPTDRGSDFADRALDTCLLALAATGPTDSDIEHLAPLLAVNFPKLDRATRLFVDVSELALRDARTGCQRVTRSILIEWLNSPPAGVEVLPVYAKPNIVGFYHARSFVAKLLGQNSAEPDVPIDVAQGDIFFGLDLCPHMDSAKVNALVNLGHLGVCVRFLVYDLLPLELPNFFADGAQKQFQSWALAISRFDGIIAISQASVDAVLQWRRKYLSNDALGDFTHDAVHLGADIENSQPTMGLPDDAPQMLSRMEARTCFLMTGTLEPRKGHTHALDAFDVLWRKGQDATLVIVGKRGWHIDDFMDRLMRHPELGKRLFLLEGISDEYLEQVYRRAGCLLAASWGEGFGLPLIEAARYGVPILARDLPVFREVAGSHAAYFDSQTAAGLADALSDWLKAHQAGQVQTSAGMPVSTWAECARKIADILLERAKA